MLLLNFFLKKLVEAFCRPVVLILFLLLLSDLHTSLHLHPLRDIRYLLPFSRNVGTAMSCHKTLDCLVRPCRLCRKIGTGHFPDCPRNLEKWSKNTSSTSAPPELGIQYRFKPPSHSTAVADDVLNDSSSSALSVNDVVKIVKQIMFNSSTPSSSALSVNSGSDLDGISNLKQDLNHHFEIKDLGTLTYFLGLEVSTTSDGYYLSEAKYAFDLLSRAGLTDSKTSSTPLEPNVRFTPLDGTPLRDPTLYHILVGSLVYLTVTRPDIAHVVHLVSQFLSAPHTTHFATILHILRYIKGTLFHCLHFSSHSSLELHAYSDADWAGDPTDRRSTTDFCFFLGTSLISWRSKK
ncbi:hypothetical protein RJ639_013022 [Escallonia herrerae]|uniref:Reverse transcriptase Ty1/copia-type domain-containing protein n=1 Tax=Escallonia herrerae TaxID=1293975 RepID=A0AA89APT1_9ASTE|nr:hypothetical protein RJ639_013022 [Escallonia herrerae]